MPDCGNGAHSYPAAIPNAHSDAKATFVSAVLALSTLGTVPSTLVPYPYSPADPVPDADSVASCSPSAPPDAISDANAFSCRNSVPGADALPSADSDSDAYSYPDADTLSDANAT